MLAKRSSLRKWRLRQVEQLKSIARRAKPIDECLKCIPAIPCAPPALERVRTVNVTMLCLFCDTLQHPDVDLPRNYLHGFPVVGDIPDSGVLRPSPPATTDEEFWTGYHELMQTNDAWAAHLAQTVLLNSVPTAPLFWWKKSGSSMTLNGVSTTTSLCVAPRPLLRVRSNT